VNDLDHAVSVGATNNDEMCNFYLLYWVEGNSAVDPQTCFSPGPPHWSWASWGLKKIPEEEASTI
jgi:peptidylglycine monooxygenase